MRAVTIESHAVVNLALWKLATSEGDPFLFARSHGLFVLHHFDDVKDERIRPIYMPVALHRLDRMRASLQIANMLAPARRKGARGGADIQRSIHRVAYPIDTALP